MLHPPLVPVRPRVILPNTRESVSIDTLLDELCLESGTIVEIVGGPGFGKTTIIDYLREVLSGQPRIMVLDEPALDWIHHHAQHGAVIYSSDRPRKHVASRSFELAPWSFDEIVEYVSNVHRENCAGIVRNLRSDAWFARLGGHPRLWRTILDLLIAEPNLVSIRSALQRMIQHWLQMPDIGEWTRNCVTRTGDGDAAMALMRKTAVGADYEHWLSLLEYRPVMVLVTARAILERLGTELESSIVVWPAEDLVEELSWHVIHSSALQQLFRSRLDHPSCVRLQPLLASVLHAADVHWKPQRSCFLDRALLRGIRFNGHDLEAIHFAEADLQGADLSNSRLQAASMRSANLALANLRSTKLIRAYFEDACLREADLSDCIATNADFRRANLVDACLERAQLRRAVFAGADLARTRLVNANLHEAIFEDANLEETDFTNAELFQANLQSAQLDRCTLQGASFRRAKMFECNLEFQNLPGADFRFADLAGALLTGTIMTGATFFGANLKGAKMADIEWEYADLRGADLRGCVFHMGSSRSGLVGSPYPGHGSRTGFYTDPYEDRYHKSPEEIRKGSLRGADLRGAWIDGVDFYLIDLRGAKFDDKQAQHLRSCNAILD